MKFKLYMAGVLLALLAPVARAELSIRTTNHYRIHTDLDPSLAEDMARRMDIMYEEYARRLVDFTPKQDERLFDVYIFARRQDYLTYTHNRFPNTGGVFVVGKALAAFLEGQGRDGLRRTLQHEAFHQFAWNAIGETLPVWLNEGLAQVFEEGIYDGHNFSIGEVPRRRVLQLQSDIEHRNLFEFRGFMAITDDQWTKNMGDKARGAAQYNQAWAMAHYLVFSPDEKGQPRFRGRLIDMLKLLRSGKHGEEAFTEAFSDNIPGFQKMFLQYARTLSPTAKATCIENQDILADMLIELDSQGRRFKDIDSFRDTLVKHQYQMEYTRGSLHWQSENDPRIYFRDLEGSYMGSDRLYFSFRNGAPLPDIISKPTSSLQLRTRFTQVGPKVEHEILVERPGQ
jgi:hypothetical protein